MDGIRHPYFYVLRIVSIGFTLIGRVVLEDESNYDRAISKTIETIEMADRRELL